MSYIVLTSAADDLRDITIHTFNRWGLEQALLYADRIEITFQKLADNPHLGVTCNDVHPGYRKFVVEMHVIYYVVDGNIITIVRILHQSRKAKPQLH